MDRRKLLLAAAAVVAALGAVLVFVYVQGADNRAEQQFDTVEVLRATGTITPGETIESAASAGKLQLQAVAQNQVLPGAQTSTEALAGRYANTTIYPGEQIIAEKFGTDASPSALTVPSGKVAASVNLTDPARVAGFVNPGSEVAVYYTGTGADGEQFSRLLLTPIQVIAVGSTTPGTPATSTADGTQTAEVLPRTLLTLALAPDQVEKVTLAARSGELSMALLPDGTKIPRSSGVTASDLFG